MVLGIWNERVSGVRDIFKFARTVVLVKNNAHDEFLIFETDTKRFDPELYHFAWNAQGNLEGYENGTQDHKFTWQPHGSQFTIFENIPQERMHLKIKIPEPMDRQKILRTVGFEHFEDWVKRIS